MSGARLVSIGVPVYNGEPRIAEVLDLLLAQDYGNLEVVVCDNCSTDATESICRGFAERDPRVKYHRNWCNLGATPNFKRVLALSMGEYFMWGAADDRWHPSYVSSLARLLEGTPSAVLAISGILPLGPNNEVGDRFFSELPRSTVGMGEVERIRYSIKSIYGHQVYGLFRTSALRESIEVVKGDVLIAEDIVLVLDVLRRGDLVVESENLFFYRMGGQGTREPFATVSELMAMHGEIARRLFLLYDWDRYAPNQVFAVQQEIMAYLNRWVVSPYKQNLVRNIVEKHRRGNASLPR